MSTAYSFKQTSLNRWLWWKEFRMLLPLCAMLLGVAAVLFIATMAADTSYNIDDLRPMIPLAFPSLFAVGCGAVLIGQEREQKTIDWMASLPMPPRHWITIKFVVAMFGLAVMWLFAFFSLLFLDNSSVSRWSIGDAQGHINSFSTYPLWILHSVYLTICGFYASWRIRNSFHAIVAVAAFACLPLLISESYRFYDRVAHRHHMSGQQVMMITVTLLVLLIPVMALLAYRAAMKTLVPQTDGLAVSALQTADRSDSVTDAALAGSFWSTAPMMTSSWSSLIWQSIRSAPLAIAIPTAILLVAMIIPLVVDAESMSTIMYAYFALIVATPFAVSWLGVLVFQNDGSAQRVRFLADRGVSPTKIFLARHAVPFAAFCLCLSMYAFFALRAASSDKQASLFVPSLATIGLAAWVLYSVAQWTSQLFHTLVLSVIVSPIVAMMVLGWFIWSISSLETPLWLLILCSFVPLLATWAMMQRYMDLRDRPRSFAVALGVAAVLIGAPVLSAVVRVRQIPSMASATRSKLLSEGETIRRSAFNPIVLSVGRPDDNLYRKSSDDERQSIELATQWLATVPTTPEQKVPRLADIRQRPRSPATADQFAFSSVFNSLMYRRLQYELHSESDEAWQAFSPWLVAATEIAGALRRSTEWNDQDIADMMEIWIADTISRKSIKARQDDAPFQDVVANLLNSSNRNTARRRAVLATWARHVDGKHTRLDQGLSSQPAYLATLMRSRRAESVVSAAMDGLSDNPTANDDGLDWLQRMHTFQTGHWMPFEFGPYAPRLRERPAIELIRGGATSPGQFWGMNWEKTIDSIIQESSK